MSHQHLETRAHQAIVNSNINAYKRKHANWRSNPAVKKSILINTLGSWQTLTLIVITGLTATLFLTMQRLAQVVALVTASIVIVAGVVAAILWIWVNFKDKKQQNRAIVQMMGPQVPFSLDDVKTKRAKVKLYQALQYWNRINNVAESVPSGPLQDRAIATRHDATRWLQTVYLLAQRTDNLQLTLASQPELKVVPATLEKYRQLLHQETDLQIKAQIEQTIALQQKKMESMQTLQNSIKQAHHQLDNTLAAMGTVHSQLLLITNTQQAKQTRSLQTDISEEIDRLQDLTEAMNEVYQTVSP